MCLAAVLVLRLILGVVLLLILVLSVILILVVILGLVLVIHSVILQILFCGATASVVCPLFQDLSLGLKIRLPINPAMIAAQIPPAVAFNPPVSIPRKPSSVMASCTPLASE